MRHVQRLLPGMLLGLGTLTSHAAGLQFTVDPDALAYPGSQPDTRRLSPGVDVALRNTLLNLELGYDFQVRMDDEYSATDDNTSQRFGATLRSAPLDRLLDARALLQANSLYTTATGGYNHRVTPGLSRPVLDVATLDVRYHYQLNRPHADAVEQARLGYSLGLNGSMQDGRLQWSGQYIATDTYRESELLTQSSETYRFQSDYELLPQMRVKLSSALTQRTEFRAAGDVDVLQTQYGAGLVWAPSPAYALDLSLQRTGLSHTGEQTLLRNGTVSWFPRRDMTLSLNYGDQLVEGAPGVLLETRLLLNRY